MDVRNPDLKEQKEHGDSFFPIKIYNAVMGKDVKDTFLHWHDEMEITFIRSGTGTYYIDFVPYEVTAGTIILIGSNSMHSAVTDDLCDCLTLVFSPSLFRGLIYDACERDYFTPLIKQEHSIPVIINNSNTFYSDFLSLIHKIVNLMTEKKNGYELGIKSYIIQMLYILYSENFIVKNNIKDAKSKTEKKARMHKIVQYVELNYFKNISIKEISSYIGISEYYFCKFFKDFSSITFSDYLNSIRINKASEMLISSDLPVTIIAMDVGFSNLSYFIRIFKKYKKRSPQSYRNQYRKTEIDFISEH